MSASALWLLLLAQTSPVAHTARVSPAAAAVGEPIEVVCDVTHPASVLPKPLEPELDPSAPWVFLDAHREPIDGAQGAASRLTWRFAGFEPGSAAPPAVEYAWRDAAGEQRATVAVDPVELAGVLAADEDAPRPLLSFRELPATDVERSSALPALALAALALLVFAAGFALERRRLRRRAPPPAVDAPAERLAALRASTAAPRARHYELTHLVREAFDRRAGADRRGLSDEEWARALAGEAGVATAARAAAEDVLSGARGPKYAGEQPTEFALRATFERAEAALRALEEGP